LQGGSRVAQPAVPAGWHQSGRAHPYGSLATDTKSLHLGRTILDDAASASTSMRTHQAAKSGKCTGAESSLARRLVQARLQPPSADVTWHLQPRRRAAGSPLARCPRHLPFAVGGGISTCAMHAAPHLRRGADRPLPPERSSMGQLSCATAHAADARQACACVRYVNFRNTSPFAPTTDTRNSSSMASIRMCFM